MDGWKPNIFPISSLSYVLLEFTFQLHLNKLLPPPLVSVTEHGICSWSCVFSSSPPRDWARLCFHHHQWWFTIQKDIFIIMKFAAGHTQFILLHFSLYIITSISYIILWWCQSQPLAAATMTVQCIYVFCVMPPWHVWCHHGSAMYVFYVMPSQDPWFCPATTSDETIWWKDKM